MTDTTTTDPEEAIINNLLLFDYCALPTLMQIDYDGRRSSDRLKPLLETIRKRLFEPDFNVSALWREHGIHDKTAASRFRELNTTPNVYITRMRLIVAERLLVGSQMPMGEIAGRVGYSNETTFGRAFRRYFELPPDEYRRKVRSKERPSYLEDRIAKGLRQELSQEEGTELLVEMEVIAHLLRLRYGDPEKRDPADPEAEARPESGGEMVH